MANAKKIFIVHGWAYSLDKWQQLKQILQDDGFKVELLKVPGLTDHSSEPWDIDQYVAWLSQQLEGQKDPVILLGHSNGGRIALNYATSYSDKIATLVLLDSAGIYHNELPIRLKRLVFKTLATLGRPLRKNQTLRKLLYGAARESDYRDAPEHMRQTMANMLESDKSLDASQVTVPTKIIWGEEDQVTPVSDARQLNAVIRGSTLNFVPGARHSPHFTHPEAVAKLIAKELT